jgi:Holliday junction resolvase RusA-like endonuclease
MDALPSYADPPFAVAPDIVLDLPMPPSVNRIWRANKAGPKHVSISPEYRQWKAHADALAMSLGQFRGLKTIAGKFEVHIVLQRQRGDLDNRAKGLLDWLQSRSVVLDDKYCERLTLEWGDAPHGARVTVKALA